MAVRKHDGDYSTAVSLRLRAAFEPAGVVPVAVGGSPCVVLLLDLDDDGKCTAMSVDGTGFDDPEDLAVFLEAVVVTLRDPALGRADG